MPWMGAIFISVLGVIPAVDLQLMVICWLERDRLDQRDLAHPTPSKLAAWRMLSETILSYWPTLKGRAREVVNSSSLFS